MENSNPPSFDLASLRIEITRDVVAVLCDLTSRVIPIGELPGWAHITLTEAACLAGSQPGPYKRLVQEGVLAPPERIGRKNLFTLDRARQNCETLRKRDARAHEPFLHLRSEAAQGGEEVSV